MTDLKYPFWVRLGIVGSKSRKKLSFHIWAMAIAAIACFALGWFYSNLKTKSESLDFYLVLGGFCLLGVIQYYLSRRRIDKHGKQINYD
jgi:hypothetical protein